MGQLCRDCHGLPMPQPLHWHTDPSRLAFHLGHQLGAIATLVSYVCSLASHHFCQHDLHLPLSGSNSLLASDIAEEPGLSSDATSQFLMGR